jgi:hypothetical protein
MTLRACSQCHRHFGAEPACPFCGTAAPPPQPRAFSPARLSRAAAFAGLASCYTSNPPPQHGPPPPPHVDQQQQQTQQQTQQQLANPPPAVVGTSRIAGLVTDSTTNRPMAKVRVELHSIDSPERIPPRSTQTDVNGRYTFVELPLGRYVVMFGVPDPRGTPQRVIDLGDGDAQYASWEVYTQPASNIPTPYGAPPARRRVV